MFTGIITGVGRIVEVCPLGEGPAHGVRLSIEAPAGYLDDVALGDSIAINGACMTATTLDVPGRRFTVDVSAESLARTAGLDRPGPVNLEKALRATDRLGGHIVSGHVDGVAEIVAMRDEGDSTRFTFRAPAALAKYIAPKGSVALNGTSLTVNEVEGTDFGVNIIPHTKSVTTWGRAQIGDRINLEIDTLARYVARLQEWKA